MSKLNTSRGMAMRVSVCAGMLMLTASFVRAGADAAADPAACAVKKAEYQAKCVAKQDACKAEGVENAEACEAKMAKCETKKAECAGKSAAEMEACKVKCAAKKAECKAKKAECAGKSAAEQEACKVKCEEKKAACAVKKAEGKAEEVTGTVVAQTMCPVMGGAVNKALYVDYDGKRIYVCCAGCIDAVKKDPAKYVKELESKGITLAVTPVEGN